MSTTSHETYQYHRIEDAPANHRIIALRSFKGQSVETIAKGTGLTKLTVRKILNHPPIMGYLFDMQQQVRESLVEQKQRLTDMAMKKVLELAENGKLTPEQYIKLAMDGMDRDVQTAKTTKNLNVNAKVNAPTQDELDKLHQIYNALPDPLKRALPSPINVTATTEEDPDEETVNRGSDVEGEGGECRYLDGEGGLQHGDAGPQGGWERERHEPLGPGEGSEGGGRREQVA
jgi:hypothetical protein